VVASPASLTSRRYGPRLPPLPFVAHGIHREPGDWHDEDEAVAVLTAAIQSKS